MANLQRSSNIRQAEGGSVHHLDTLEISATKNSTTPAETYARWTFAKRQSWKNSFQLCKLDSPLKKQYNESLHCRRVLLQEGDVFHSITCKKRWCKACSHIRTADMINGYGHLLEVFDDAHYVVLTMKNCKARQLKSMIQRGFNLIKQARNKLQRMGVTADGIVTMECTYNVEANEYHPHYNVVCNDRQVAEYIMHEWLNHWKEKAVRQAQFIAPINSTNDLLEVFKYVTKMAVETDGQIMAQDTIYQTIKGMRITRPFGKLRKAKVKEEKQVSESVDEANHSTEIWVYQPDTMHYENARCDTLASDHDIQLYEHSRKPQKRQKSSLSMEVHLLEERASERLKMRLNASKYV